MRIFVHKAEIMRLTEQYDVNQDEIIESGALGGNLSDATDRALADCSRGAIVNYWRTFYCGFLNGSIDIDADGLFQWDFDFQDYN